MCIAIGVAAFFVGIFIGAAALAMAAASGRVSAQQEGFEMGWNAAIRKMQKLAQNSIAAQKN